METEGDEVYLDNAATTRPYDEVIDVVAQAMRDHYGNPSSRHARGKDAHNLLEASRAILADALGVSPSEVYFTSGATESDNLAITGVCRRLAGERRGIVTTEVEHAAVTKTVRSLKREGWDARYIAAANGELDLDGLSEALDSQTALVSTMQVQNEVGFIFPVREVVALRDRLAPQALVHTDAVQAFGKMDFRPSELGVDLASVCAHKIGGPIGVGALYVRRGTELFTTACGGGQERGLRSGTEALPLIMGFAKAAQITLARRERAFNEVTQLKQRLLTGVSQLCPDVRINSRDDGSPYIVSICLPGVDNGALIDFLSARGVYVSHDSACKTLHPDVEAKDWRPKHRKSLLATGVPGRLLESTLRISFAQTSHASEVDRFLEGLAAFISANQQPGR